MILGKFVLYLVLFIAAMWILGGILRSLRK
jgi:hypothetical protein